MAELKLANGKTILIDDKDFDLVNQFTWSITESNRPFARFMRNGKVTRFYLYQLLLPKRVGFEIDHINRNPLDNQRRNLRYATASQNHANAKIYKSNKSGFKGVGFHKDKIRAYIQVDNKHKHLGYFGTLMEAAKAYNEAAKRYFGKFARLNKIGGI